MVFLFKIDDILGEHATLFKDHYYIKPPGNCDLSRMSDPHNEFKGKNVLIELNDTSALASKLGLPIEKYLDILGECKRKLFDARSRRPRPHLEDKVLCELFKFLSNVWLLSYFHALTDQMLAR